MLSLNRTQKAVMILTSAMGALILALCTIAVSEWLIQRPDLSSLAALEEGLRGKTPEESARLIAAYKTLSDLHQMRITGLFDLIVSKALVPVFSTLVTAVLAYVFTIKSTETVRTYLEARVEQFRTNSNPSGPTE